jgi:hypothetical protein
LYGKPPPFITAAIARIDYELMVEQHRQEALARAKADGTVIHEEAAMKLHDGKLHAWIRSGRIKLRL